MFFDLLKYLVLGFGNEGVWRAYGVNECIRFTKYISGGHFNAHRDGSFVLDDEKRSIYTIMVAILLSYTYIKVYLNEGYKGGDTNFYSLTKNQILASIHGEAGTGLSNKLIQSYYSPILSLSS